MMPQPRSAQAKDAVTPRLDRDRILAAAEEIAATEGAQALSMRRLGEELGINHTAIYRHFRDKAELLAAIADRVLERRVAPIADGDWRQTLGLQLRHAIGRYDVHPELAQVVALRPSTTETLAGHMERALAALQEVGLSIEDAAEMYEITEGVVVGFGLYASLLKHAKANGETLDDDAERRMLAVLPPDQYPHVAAAAPFLFQGLDQIYDRAVEVLLDAIERRAAK